MTLRAYLMLLRPVRTLLFTAFYGWAMGFNIIKTVAGQPTQEALFLTFAVLGPIVLGAFLLGPLHEVMHRSFAAQLPGLRTAFGRWHLVACGLAAVSFFCGAAALGFPFPPAASAGLILAGLSAPLLNRRRSIGWGALLGMAGYLTLVAVVALPSRALLLEAGRAFPWAILVAGVAFAAFCFRHGFSAEGVRERSRSAMLFCCLQSSFPLVGSGGFAVTRHMQTENGRLLAARKAGRTAREWNITSVGSSVREWAAVVHHCRFGGSSRGQFASGLLILGAAPLFTLAVIQFFMSRADPNHPITLSESCAQLATAFRPGAAPDLISTLLYLSALLFGLAGSTSFVASIVLAPYPLPLSRHRLAQSTLLAALRLTSLVAAGILTGLGVLAMSAILFAGQPLDAGLLTRPLAATLVLIPAALLIQAFVYRAARHYWLLIAGITIPLLGGSVLAGALASKLGPRAAAYSPAVLLDRAFTPTGITILLALTGLAAALHWLALRRHFRTCDLSRPVLQVAPGRSS